jgi:hypothetical protein
MPENPPPPHVLSSDSSAIIAIDHRACPGFSPRVFTNLNGDQEIPLPVSPERGWWKEKLSFPRPIERGQWVQNHPTDTGNGWSQGPSGRIQVASGQSRSRITLTRTPLGSGISKRESEARQ